MPSFTGDYTFDQQYRVVNKNETGDSDAMSLRSAIAMERNINNYKKHVGHHKIISLMYPLGLIQSPSSSTTEKVMLSPFAPIYVPHGYNKLRLWSGTIRTSGASTTTWKLYYGSNLYRGPEDFDGNFLKNDSFISFVTNSDSHQIYENTGYLSGGSSLVNHYDNWRYIWPVLTAKNGDASSQSDLITLDVQLVIE